MRISGSKDQALELGSSPELRQVANASNDLVQLLVTRPPIYYGDGPFDPPSSDSDDDEEEHERVPDAQHEFEDDVETVSLLTNTPRSPGHAESGGFSGSQMRSGTDKVGFLSVRQLEAHALNIFSGILFYTISRIYPRCARRTCWRHWCRCRLYVFRDVEFVCGPEKAYYGPHIQWDLLRQPAGLELGSRRYD